MVVPVVAMGPSGTNEDDLTIKLADILYINQFGIKRAFEQGGPTSVQNILFTHITSSNSCVLVDVVDN